MEEKKELRPGKTSLRDIPWKPFLVGLGALGAGTLGGYVLGGLTTNAILNSRALSNWVGNDPRKYNQVYRALRVGTSATGAVAGLTPLLAHLAVQQHLYEATQKKEKERQEKEALQNPKVAHVIDIYRMALERMQ